MCGHPSTPHLPCLAQRDEGWLAKLTIHVQDDAADNWRCQIIILRPARQLHVEILALELGQREDVAHASLRERMAQAGAVEHCVAVPPGNPRLWSTCSKEETRIIECTQLSSGSGSTGERERE